jgi:hypothetical protein
VNRLVAIALVGLALAAALVGMVLALGAGLRRARPPRLDVPIAAAESGLRISEAAAAVRGPVRVRAAAARREAWPETVPGLAETVDVGRPVALGALRPAGTELAVRDQLAFTSDVYRIGASVREGAALEAELVMPPTWTGAAPPDVGAVPARALLVGPPLSPHAFHADAYGYRAFAASEARRRTVAVTLGNDGIVRGVDVAGSAPVFLANVGGSGGGLTYEDVYLDAPWAPGGEPCPAPIGPGKSCRWRTLLFGANGREAFALDVTRADPEGVPGRGLAPCAAAGRAGCSGVYGTLVWKTPLASAATPEVARVRVSSAGAPRERSVVAIGSSDAKGGALSLLDAGTGRVLYETSTGVAMRAGSASDVRIAAVRGRAAAIDEDGDGFADAIYFGDALGRVWKTWTPSEDSKLGAEAPTASGPRIAGSASRSWTPLLFFEGEGDVVFPPAVVSEGLDPRTGRPLFGVAWGTGGRVTFVLDEGPETASLPFSTRSFAGAGAPEEIADPRAPALGGCGREEPIRRNGWTLRLPVGESVASQVLAIRNTLYVASKSRLYRLAALSGDPCHGAECCEARAPFAPGDRGASLGGELSVLRAFTDASGVLHVGAVVGVSGASRVVSIPAGGAPALRDFHQP